MSLTYKVLTIAGIALLIALRAIPPLIAKSGIMPKRWQLWVMGDPRNGKPPHPDDIVM